MADSHLITDPTTRASEAAAEIHALIHGIACIIDSDMDEDEVCVASIKTLLWEIGSRNALIRGAVAEIEKRRDGART